jgi:hypothetical protein
MGLVPNKGAVQELAPASPDPAFADRAHPGRLDAAEHRLDPCQAARRLRPGGQAASKRLITPVWPESASEMYFHAAARLQILEEGRPQAGVVMRPSASLSDAGGHRAGVWPAKDSSCHPPWTTRSPGQACDAVSTEAVSGPSRRPAAARPRSHPNGTPAGRRRAARPWLPTRDHLRPTGHAEDRR